LSTIILEERDAKVGGGGVVPFVKDGKKVEKKGQRQKHGQPGRLGNEKQPVLEHKRKIGRYQGGPVGVKTENREESGNWEPLKGELWAEGNGGAGSRTGVWGGEKKTRKKERKTH